MSPKIFFMSILSIIVAFDIMIAVLCFLKKDKKGRMLGISILSVISLSISYAFSATLSNYTAVSVMSSIYFLSVDACLLFYLGFISYENSSRIPTKVDRIISLLMKIWFVVEIILFFINIFVEIEVHYVPDNAVFAKYTYEMKPLYYIHLVYTYTLVIALLSILIARVLKVPKEYKNRYLYVIFGVLLVIIINIIFLYIPKTDNIWGKPDYSIFLFSTTLAIAYWSTYYYTKSVQLVNIKNTIFENIDQGILLFDFEDNIIVTNEKMQKFLAITGVKLDAKLDEFLEKANIAVKTDEESYSIQCYATERGKQKPYRCDFKKLRNENLQFIGSLFVFSDAQLDTDLLTGFHSWESFRYYANEHKTSFPKPSTVAVCDINRLAMINTIHGRNAGDQLIKKLAETMHRVFQEDAYYVRGNNAYLIAICYNQNEDDTKKELSFIQSEFEVNIQFAVAETSDDDASILETIIRAYQGLKAKKLLDSQSAKSALIGSLVKALEECDSDTEAHVGRTQRLGAALGKRIGLSDVDLSRLSLLCLLHDIGKIGVPLEVLNKPGKLTDAEWELIKEHVIKGEAIANSTPELTIIAEYIRSHHERWDGRGYPDGLSRESIPLLSRVISIVDSFDAMVNNRSYRKGMPIEAAKDEIKRCAGSQFDPSIAAEFITMLDNGYVVETNTENDNVTIKTAPSQKTEWEDELVDNAYIHEIYYAKYTLNINNEIISIDNKFTELSGYTQNDIKEKKLTQWDLLPEEDRADYIRVVYQQMASNPMAYLEHRLLCADGSIKYVYCLGKKYFDSVERIEKVEIIVTNASTTHSSKMLSLEIEKKAENQLKRWEETYRKDSLTGLMNHTAFISDVEQHRLNNPDSVLLFCMIDLDKFKDFNDTYGHRQGDEYLILVGKAILGSIGPDDLAARMGGDEFAVISFMDKDSDYKSYANHIFNNISAKLSTLDKHTSFSMGVAISSEELDTFNKLYEASDKGLYRSKDGGRNRVTFFNLDTKESDK